MSSTMARLSRNSFSAAGLATRAGRARPRRRRCRWPAARPSRRARATGVDHEVQRGGHHHAAHGGEDRQGGHPPVAQVADHELALDLERDHQEEQRHQAVVDEVTQVHLDAERAHAHVDVVVPEGLVALVPRRVGPRERHQGGGDEDEPARGLGVQEAPHGDRQAASREGLARRRSVDVELHGGSGAALASTPTRLPGTPSVRLAAGLRGVISRSAPGHRRPGRDGAAPGEHPPWSIR